MPTRARSVKKRLSPYENTQIEEIAAWKSQAPNPISELWNLTALQAAKALTWLLPQVVVRSAIEASYKTAVTLAGRAGLADRAGVNDVTELRKKPLEECDGLAKEVARISKTLAFAEGAATGAGGLWTTAVDVPLLFISALRTIIRTGYCYGYPADRPTARYLNLGILTIAMAGSLATRQERLDQLQDLEKILVEETQVDLVRSELLSFLFQLEVFEEVPGIGIISGALLNLKFMHDVDTTARRVFQERWLKDNGKIVAISPAEQIARNLVPGWSGLAGRAAYSAVFNAAYGITLPLFTLKSLLPGNDATRPRRQEPQAAMNEAVPSGRRRLGSSLRGRRQRLPSPASAS